MRAFGLAALAAILAMPLVVHGRVIWAHDYDDAQSTGPMSSPHLRYTAGSGNDYLISEQRNQYPYSVALVNPKGIYVGGHTASLALDLNDGLSHTDGFVRVTVPMNRFDTFQAGNGADSFHFRFDFGVDHFVSEKYGTRFVLKPDDSHASNLVIGFGVADIGWGGKQLFFYAANGGTTDMVSPSLANAIGLTSAGTAFEKGFNFGTLESEGRKNNTASEEAYSPTIPDLYRFEVTFDGSTYDGRVTRLDLIDGVETTDIAEFTVNVAPVTLSSSDPNDRFYLTTEGQNEVIRSMFDNFEFSVTPEPGSAMLMVTLAGIALQRRRFARRG